MRKSSTLWIRTRYIVALAVAAGFGLGAVVVQVLHAQAKPPVYYIAEIDVTNADAYAKEYVPLAQASIKGAGGRFLAVGGKLTSFDGAPPKARVAVQVWESVEKIRAWHESAAYQEARKIGNKYANFRSFAIEGVAQ
jgi:uncharacterized protein (DUF1330 family)